MVKFQERMNSSNIDRILDHGWDVIVDGVDNFPTRYLLNDATVWKKIPVVHGSIFRFDGQVTTFVVERSFPGFSAGDKIDKMGMRASTMCELVMDGCEVPAENLLGREGAA